MIEITFIDSARTVEFDKDTDVDGFEYDKINNNIIFYKNDNMVAIYNLDTIESVEIDINWDKDEE